MEKTILTRKQLYELVWKTPLNQLAKRYNLSFNELRQICIKMEIPTPENGHWQKLKFGKAVNIKELPKNFTGKNEVELPELESDSDLLSLNKHKNKGNEKPLQNGVPQKLKNPDKLILSTKEYYRNIEHKTHYDLYTSNNVLNINVSKRSLNRALIILDSFIKLVKTRGHDVIIEYRRSKVVMFTVEEEFTIREKYDTNKREKYSYNKAGSSGILVFKAKCCYHKTWEDSKLKRLEEKIPQIVEWFEAGARDTKSRWDENEKRRIIEEECKRREQELKEQKDNEIKRFKTLLDESDRWHKARIIREYVNQINPNHLSNLDNFSDWITWAKSKADWYDPLVKKEDDILGFFDELD